MVGTTGARVDLRWLDTSSVSSEMEVARSTDGGATYRLAGTAPPTGDPGGIVLFSDSSAAALTSYRYRARAVNGSGVSGWSNTADASTPTAAPPAPAGLQAAVTGMQVELAWRSVATETGYVVERRRGFLPWAAVGETAANVVRYTDGTVASGAPYLYRVRARNNVGVSAPSNEVSATIPAGGRLSLSERRLSYGTLRAGERKRLSVTLTNTGTGPLAGNVATVGAPFRVVLGGGRFTLAPGAGRTVTAEFVPTTAGTHTVFLLITSSDRGAPRVSVELTGRRR